MERMFRLLKPSEIECRVQTCNEDGVSLLLYKDARCDMNILDEKVGAMNWKRDHKELKGNIYCGVSIYNNDTGRWTTKWDAGAESYTEKEKGEASDSFKRACVNWGIGRELYTSPYIWIDGYTKEKNGRWVCATRFKVRDIEYMNGVVTYLLIQDKNGVIVYQYKQPRSEMTPRMRLMLYCDTAGLNLYDVAEKYGINKQSTDDEIEHALGALEAGE